MCVTAADTTDKATVDEPDETAPPALPRLPTQAETTRGEASRTLREVRRFHLSGSSAMLDLPGEGTLPALLHQFRDAERVRSDYPLLLLPPHSDHATAPLGDWLLEQIESSKPELRDARLLGDNLSRVELAARRRMSGIQHCADAASMIRCLAGDVASALSLRDHDIEKLEHDLGTLAEKLPDGSCCISLGEHAAVRLGIHATIRHRAEQREALMERATVVRDGLRRLLADDDHKRTQSEPGLLSSALGGKTSGIDPAALAKMVGQRQGQSAIPDERRERIERTLESIDAMLEATTQDPVHLVHGGELSGLEGLPEGFELHESVLPCADAVRLYDEAADRLAPLALALRIGELEITDSFDPDVYAPVLESFGRDTLAPGERLVIPPIIAVETIERVTGTDMPNVTRALLSGRPIRVLLETESATNLIPHTEHDPLAGFRFEAGSFGLGHRQAIVHQSAAGRTDHLFGGLTTSLSSARASLHVIATGMLEDGSAPAMGASLHAGAALEGRAHALFLYNPEAGPSWADRMDFSANEQPDADWPRHDLECLDGGGAPHTIQLTFTFADFALLEPAYRDHYRVIPENCPANDLTPVQEYPRDDSGSVARRVPFVWGVDETGRMCRLAISRRLLEACRDRLSHWHTLQELSGIHNEYVERAIASEREALRSEAQEQIDLLRKQHTDELDDARREAAGEAMRKLAEMLLEVDPSEMARRVAPAPAPTIKEPTPDGSTDAAPEPVAPAADEEEDLGFDEPYIDSPLCTTCNDCININAQLFVYNENKQAIIGDPNAGTFQQLVVAAEKCPARCIHPGKPRNPDEANLQELIERAKPFN